MACNEINQCPAYNQISRYDQEAWCYSDSQWQRCQYHSPTFANSQQGTGMYVNNGFQQQQAQKDKRGTLILVVVVIVLVLMGAGVLSLAAVFDWIRSIF